MILTSVDIAKNYVEEIAKIIQDNNLSVKLVSFLANDDPSAVRYAESTEQTCVDIGIKFELRIINKELLEDAIIEANNDDSINGIMVYYPVFGGGHDQYIQNCVNPYKDVEGLSHFYLYNMYNNIRYINVNLNLKNILPVTPLAIYEILKYCKVCDSRGKNRKKFSDKTITIINRSELVGRPLAALLANNGAHVFSFDVNNTIEYKTSSTKHAVMNSNITLQQALPISDVVITGVPNEDYKVNTNLLKQDVVAINFSSFQNFEDTIEEKACLYVPSVGKMTVTMLQRNLLKLSFNQIRKI